MLDEKNWSELETLSTEELEALIQADWQQQSTDASDKIYRALTILESRGALACGSVDVDAAWQEFNTHYNTPEGKNACLYPIQTPAEGAAPKKARRIVWKTLSAVAAIFTLVLILTVPVFGEKNLLQHIGQWTKHNFTFSDGKYHGGYTEEGSGDIAFQNAELIDVYMELLAQGCNARLVPTWIPDGFSLVELTTEETPRNIKVVACFAGGEKNIVLSYAIHTEEVSSLPYYEKDDLLTVETIAGIDHYFFPNASQNVCAWISGRIECSISGNISQQELRKMVLSVYTDQANNWADRTAHTPGLDSVSVELVAQGCDRLLVPTWLPAGYEMTGLDTSKSPARTRILATFEKGEKSIAMVYAIYPEGKFSGYRYEKSDSEVIIERIGDIEHHFFRNGSQYMCVWVAGGVECSISSDTSQEELRKIVHSIYSEVDAAQEDSDAQNQALKDLSLELLAQGCDAQLVPTWIPQGFSLTLQETTEMYRFIQVYAFFENGDQCLTLEYSILTGEEGTGYYYEKSGDKVILENIAGVDHYFFRNASQYVCVWTVDGVECSISGNVSQEELRKIVCSIYSDMETSQEDRDAQIQALQDLSREVAAQGCNAAVVPTRIPDGFSLTVLDTSETPWNITVHALFENGEETLSITYLIPTADNSGQGYYEKSDDEVILENIAGVDHYFFRNASRYVCVWTIDGVECSISLSGSLEELRKIVCSIYAAA